MPTKSITANDRNRVKISPMNPRRIFLLTAQSWLREFFMTIKSVVATKKRNRNPKTITYQLSLKPRMLLITSRTCCAPSAPRFLDRFSMSPRPTILGEKNNPNNWAIKKTIGGKAKVVKKAVAPASLSGSFFFNNLNDSKRLLKKLDTDDCCVSVDFTV